MIERYDSKEELEDHIRRRHTKYNCDQCDNWYKNREDLEDHRKRTHSKECEEKLECRKESEVEIEEIQEVVGIMVHDLSDQSADYSSYDDKMIIESADNSSYDDKLRIESAVIVSYDDKSRIKSTEELEKKSTIEKQNIK